MAEILSEKEIQQLLDFIKENTRDEKLVQLNLPPQEKNKLDIIVGGIDKYEAESAEKLAQTFLDIHETFSFDELGVHAIKKEMVRGFAREQLKRLDVSPEQRHKILKTIMEEEEEKVKLEFEPLKLLAEQEKEKVKEAAAPPEKTPKQELLEKAYEQLLKQKEYFLKILNELNLDKKGKKVLSDIIFFSDNAKEILKILGVGEEGFILIKKADYAKNVLEDKDGLIQKLKEVDDEEFVKEFESDREFFYSFIKTWTEFSSTLVEPDWFTEFNFLFSFVDNKPELAGQIQEKLEPLFKHFGYEQIYPKRGEEYNPREHKVEGEIAEAGVKRGQVVRVARRGIKKGSEVILKARVVIAK